MPSPPTRGSAATCRRTARRHRNRRGTRRPPPRELGEDQHGRSRRGQRPRDPERDRHRRVHEPPRDVRRDRDHGRQHQAMASATPVRSSCPFSSAPRPRRRRGRALTWPRTPPPLPWPCSPNGLPSCSSTPGGRAPAPRPRTDPDARAYPRLADPGKVEPGSILAVNVLLVSLTPRREALAPRGASVERASTRSCTVPRRRQPRARRPGRPCATVPRLFVAWTRSLRAPAHSLWRMSCGTMPIRYTGVIVILLERKHDAVAGEMVGRRRVVRKPVDPFELADRLRAG